MHCCRVIRDCLDVGVVDWRSSYGIQGRTYSRVDRHVRLRGIGWGLLDQFDPLYCGNCWETGYAEETFCGHCSRLAARVSGWPLTHPPLLRQPAVRLALILGVHVAADGHDHRWHEPAMKTIRGVVDKLVPKARVVRVQMTRPRAKLTLRGNRICCHRDRQELPGGGPCGLFRCLISTSFLDAVEVKDLPGFFSGRVQARVLVRMRGAGRMTFGQSIESSLAKAFSGVLPACLWSVLPAVSSEQLPCGMIPNFALAVYIRGLYPNRCVVFVRPGGQFLPSVPQKPAPVISC